MELRGGCRVKTPAWLLALILVMAGGAFAIDFAAGLHTPAGALYLLAVLVSLTAPDGLTMAVVAGLCGLLAVVGSPMHALADRVPLLMALGTVAALGMQRRKAEALLRTRSVELEARVQEAQGQSQRAAELLHVETEKRRQIEGAQARLSALLAGSPNFVAIATAEGRVMYVNRSGRLMLGIPDAEDITALTFRDLYPEHMQAAIHDDVCPVAARNGIWKGPSALVKRDGTQLEVDLAILSLRNPQGAVEYWGVVSRDITEQKRAETALQESEARIRAIFDAALDCIITIDQNGRIIEFNRAAEKTFGYTHDEVMGQELDELLYPSSSRERCRDNMDRYNLRREEGSLLGKRVEVNTRRKNGEEFIAEMAMQPVTLAGSIVFTVFLRNVTKRRQAEEKLDQERYLLHTLMDNLPDSIYFKNSESRFMRVSRGLALKFGLDGPAEALGKTDFDFFTEQHARQAWNDEQQMMSSGEPVLGKEEMETWPDGHRTWASTTKLPLRDKDGHIVGTFGISRDITQQKRVEEALRIAKEAAEAASRAKSDFLANMSHEIRTPMNAVIGMTELVLDTQLTSDQRDYLKMVLESADSLLLIINDILDFSKIEAGKLDLEHILFDLHESVGDTMKSLAVRAHKKGLELTHNVPADVPGSLIGDPNRLRQIVVNLVGNAIKFTDKGEVVLTVHTESQTDNEVVLHFAVTDTGIGIPPEKRDDIFKAFEQADTSTTRRFGGTGLGLTISSRLVELMGGKLWVESEVGRGSTFHFTAGFERGSNVAPPRPERAERASLIGLRVLVVDDNATNRRILEEILRNWKMQPTAVAGAAQALEALDDASRNGTPFPLVLTDGNMPEIDGFTLAQRIKQSESLSGPIIMMLSSADRSGDIARCEQMGISGYLMKPIKQSELFDAIATAVGLSPSATEVVVPNRYHDIRPLRILLAEDSLVNQKLGVGLLERQGHTVTIANNGREAVAALQSQDFDVVLMDVQMPEMDGLEATRLIRAGEQQSGRHVPIVAMTAHAMKGDRERGLAAGMDAYLVKPIRAKQVYETLRSIVTGLPEPAPAGSDNVLEETVFDWSTALRNVNNDSALLKEVVLAFLEECPRLMQQLRQALELADVKLLQRSAHTIKGALRTFGTEVASDYASRIESIARTGGIDEAGISLSLLEREIATLIPVLSGFVREAELTQNSPASTKIEA